MSYQVTITEGAAKALAGLPERVRAKLLACIRALGTNPGPAGIMALRGEPPGTYRLRVGDYRVGYWVDDGATTVLVRCVGDRARFYERLKRSGQ